MDFVIGVNVVFECLAEEEDVVQVGRSRFPFHADAAISDGCRSEYLSNDFC